MDPKVAEKFAQALAECAVRQDHAGLRKEAAAYQLIKQAEGDLRASPYIYGPAIGALLGGAGGYFSDDDEKKKLRNVLYGAGIGGLSGLGVAGLSQWLRPPSAGAGAGVAAAKPPATAVLSPSVPVADLADTPAVMAAGGLPATANTAPTKPNKDGTNYAVLGGAGAGAGAALRMQNRNENSRYSLNNLGQEALNRARLNKNPRQAAAAQLVSDIAARVDGIQPKPAQGWRRFLPAGLQPRSARISQDDLLRAFGLTDSAGNARPLADRTGGSHSLTSLSAFHDRTDSALPISQRPDARKARAAAAARSVIDGNPSAARGGFANRQALNLNTLRRLLVTSESADAATRRKQPRFSVGDIDDAFAAGGRPPRGLGRTFKRIGGTAAGGLAGSAAGYALQNYTSAPENAGRLLPPSAVNRLSSVLDWLEGK